MNQIIETKTFDLLLTTDVNTFFIDLEGTVLAPNAYYEAIRDSRYASIFTQICGKLPIDDVLYFGKNYQRKLTEPNIPTILNIKDLNCMN